MQEQYRGAFTGIQLASYFLQELIGLGGAAEVYRGTDLTLGREVAVKVLLPILSQDNDFVQRFRDEARRVAALDNPHIVPAYFYGEDQGYLFLVMPLLRGGSLRQRLRAVKRLPPEEAIRITLDVAAALETAHRAHLIHRDVKPENILFNAQGEALLADFGLARILPQDPALWEQHNTTGVYGVPVGTPSYMAPEQFQRTATLDQRADIYALGVVLYEMLTGQVPFSGTPRDLGTRVTSRPCPLPSTLAPGVWPALDPRVMTALAVRPEARYPTAAAFADALRQTATASTTGPTDVTVATDVTVLETRPTTAVPAPIVGTAELPVFYKLPTPPELMEPEPWPVQVTSEGPRVARPTRLALLVVLALLVIASSTGGGVLLADALGSASAPPRASVSPTVPLSPTPTTKPAPTPSPTTVPFNPGAITSPTPSTMPSPTPTPTATPSPTPTPVPTGLIGQYYNDVSTSPTLPLPCGTPAYSHMDSTVDFGTAPNQLPPDNLPPPSNNSYYFGVCWSGSIVAQYSEQYTFTLSLYGQAEVVINNTAVIPASTEYGSIPASGTISLVANQPTSITIYYIGYYPSYYKAYNVIRLFWQSAHVGETIVPQTALRPSS
jgi:serine/threonine-protein kinase